MRTDYDLVPQLQALGLRLAFMDAADPATVYSSIDHGGRYAFGNQPTIAQWNLARLAEALLPLIDPDEAKAVATATELVRGFEGHYQRHWRSGLRAKLGLAAAPTTDGADADVDRALGDDFVGLLVEHQVDYTNGFRALVTAATGDLDALAELFPAATAYQPWLDRWRARLGDGGPAAASSMRLRNPAFIARNHRVEDALTAAIERMDFRPFETLLAILARPFDDQPEHAPSMAPPPMAVQRRHVTFCGT